MDEKGKAIERIEITSVTIRDRPADRPPAFSTESPAELAAYRVTLETTVGAITLELRPDKAPEHVRNFLRLAAAGVYDGTRVPPRGARLRHPGRLDELPAGAARRAAAEARRARCSPSSTTSPHVKGTLSMARGDDPASASTSFFICTAPAPGLDRVYTAFGRVVDGMAVVEAIEAAPVDGETPKERIEIVRARVTGPVR